MLGVSVPVSAMLVTPFTTRVVPMSLEVRIEQLESHFDSLDSAVRSLIEITGDTHQEILATRREMREYQQENRLRFAQHDRELSEIKAAIGALTEATYAGFKRSDEKIEQLELLIRQHLPNN